MKVAGLTIALAVLALIFGAIERRWPSIRGVSIWRRARRIDFVYWFFTPLVTKSISTLAALIVVVILARGASPSSSWPASLPVTAQVIVTLIAADLTGYISHRLFHRPALWRFHAIHHSSEELDWLSATRLHPVNEVLTRTIQVVPLYLLGFRGEVLAGIVPLLTLWAIFIHSNVGWSFGPLRFVIASPRFHRWHHTSEEEGLDKNFAGLFPWIDLLFGTFYMPPGREPRAFGVSDDVPRTFAGQLVWPFRRPTVSSRA